MSAEVPIESGISLLDRSSILVGDPVRGQWWRQAAKVANHLLGRGGALIPWCGVKKSIALGATATYRWKVFPRVQATHRLWLFGATGAGWLTFTDPSGGTLVAYPAAAAGVVPMFWHVETITSPTSSESALVVTFANSGSAPAAVTLESIACFEIPRPELAVDATQLGVDVDTLRSSHPIFSDTGLSLGGLAARMTDCRDVAKRCALFQFARTAADALQASTGSFVELLSGRPPVLDRFIYRNETQVTIPIRIYTRSDVGTTGDIKFTMANTATTTISITSGDTGTWRSGTISVDAEDLGAGDGRRSSRWDTCKVEGKTTAGVGKIFVESIGLFGRAN